jgi:hypothetical protein
VQIYGGGDLSGSVRETAFPIVWVSPSVTVQTLKTQAPYRGLVGRFTSTIGTTFPQYKMFWSPWFPGSESTILTSTEEQSSSRREEPTTFKRLGNGNRELYRGDSHNKKDRKSEEKRGLARGSPAISERLRCDLEAGPDLQKIGQRAIIP